MGGKPSKGTKRDKRLKGNKQAQKPRRNNGVTTARRRFLRRFNG